MLLKMIDGKIGSILVLHHTKEYGALKMVMRVSTTVQRIKTVILKVPLY